MNYSMLLQSHILPKIKGRGNWRRHLSPHSSVWLFGYSHDSQVLVEKPHWHSGSPQQHAGLASLEMAFKKPTSERDARLKWGTENSVARQPTFAKATDVYLFKGGGGGGMGPVKVWTKREKKRRTEGQESIPYVFFLLLDWWERLNRLQWEHEAFPSLHFPRIGKEPGYTVGLQSNGAVTSALVKTVLWPMYRQASRPAENQQGTHVRTMSGFCTVGQPHSTGRELLFHTNIHKNP